MADGPSEGERVGRLCLVSGHVQGVFFRASTRDEARRLGLGGSVRNLPDGRVEVRVFGAVDPVRRLCGWLEVGPTHARVDEVRCAPIAYERHEEFRVG